MIFWEPVGVWRIVKLWARDYQTFALWAVSARKLLLPAQSSVATVAGIPRKHNPHITGAIVGVGATKRLSAVRWALPEILSGHGF